MIDRDINPFMNDEYDLTKRILFNQKNSTNTCSIGTIVSINSSPISVNVQPSIRYFDKLEGFKDSPILEHLPVMQLASNLASIRLPLVPGNVGVILWVDREVYSWLDSVGVGPKAPDSGNLCNESAAIFIPFMQKFSQALPVKSLGVDIVSSEISLLTQLTNFANDLQTFANSVSIATTIPQITTAAGILNSSLTPIIANLTTFKGDQ